MNSIAIPEERIFPMNEIEIDNVRQLENLCLKLPQTDIGTQHVLHGGMYARTIMIPAGVMLTGALIKIATLLVVCGDVTAYLGNKSTAIKGYRVLAASANRKQAFFAESDTYLTMVFPTNAVDTKRAEEEFTDEADLLISRKSESINHIINTGV